MKLRVLNIITSLFITACIVTSCLGEDTGEYDFSTDASITAFSIKDSIVTYYPATTANGKDTTLSFGVLGSDYPFVINHNEGLIYNQDSLPIGTDVSKVVVNITADTYGIYAKGYECNIRNENQVVDIFNDIDKTESFVETLILNAANMGFDPKDPAAGQDFWTVPVEKFQEV